MNKKTTLFLLIIICAFSFFINLYKQSVCPPGFNTDEAAFGYNAYSLLKTGRDEYGIAWPLRLKSFGDYKMPLYTYLTIPFIAFNGLNENSIRAPNSVVALIFPVIMFFLGRQLFSKKIFGLLAALLLTLAPAIQTIGHQAHEAYLTTFLISLSLWLLLRIYSGNKRSDKVLFLLSLIPLSLGYQFSRLWIILFFLIIFFWAIQKKVSTRFLFISLFLCLLLILPDVFIRPARVNNLLFYKNIGLGLQTAELRSEGGHLLIYNKATVGLKNLIFNHISFYSPQFLVINGDENRRFAYPGISPITLVEYIFTFIGLYFLFKDRQKYRFLLLIGFLFSPLAASLSWAGFSITRSLPLIIFINLIVAYGFVRCFIFNLRRLTVKVILGLIVFCYLVFCFYSWDFFFNHYPKRAFVIRAWQSGNREMANYVKSNYHKFNQFIITKKNGQPYIFLLFYLAFPPDSYQKQAQLSPPDEFGYGQVEKFDKFNFQFHYDPLAKKTAYIGYPDDFANLPIDSNRIKKIKINTEEVFWIYEQN